MAVVECGGIQFSGAVTGSGAVWLWWNAAAYSLSAQQPAAALYGYGGMRRNIQFISAATSDGAVLRWHQWDRIDSLTSSTLNPSMFSCSRKLSTWSALPCAKIP